MHSLVGETLPDAPPQVAEVVEILIEVDADTGLLKTLILVETVDAHLYTAPSGKRGHHRRFQLCAADAGMRGA